jgi:hypothetical protein
MEGMGRILSTDFADFNKNRNISAKYPALIDLIYNLIFPDKTTLVARCITPDDKPYYLIISNPFYVFALLHSVRNVSLGRK